MSLADDVALAFASMRSVMAGQTVTLTFSNPTIAATAGLCQWTRRVPRDHDGRGGPSVVVEAEFQVLALAVAVDTLHADQTTISDGTYTWRLREQPDSQEGYFLTLRCWRALDYDES